MSFCDVWDRGEKIFVYEYRNTLIVVITASLGRKI